ncbi:MAG: signal peptidase I [Chthonomonadales bacterium]
MTSISIRTRRRRTQTIKLGIVAVVFGIGLTSVCAQGFSVSGKCMEPNLQEGERLLSTPVPYWFSTPGRGDVVVFESPGLHSQTFVKRVIGIPNDEVRIRAGNVYVNGNKCDEPYRKNIATGDYGPVNVEKGKLFVLGDNRDKSNDSRTWGQLPISQVKSKAVGLYWPPSSWRLL